MAGIYSKQGNSRVRLLVVLFCQIGWIKAESLLKKILKITYRQL